MADGKGKRSLQQIGCVLFVIVILVVTLYAGFIYPEEMNHLFNWIFH